jgi:hypothetical protein
VGSSVAISKAISQTKRRCLHIELTNILATKALTHLKHTAFFTYIATSVSTPNAQKASYAVPYHSTLKDFNHTIFAFFGKLLTQ